MAITISGENNNDRITAQDGVIDTISGFNIAGIITASSFTGDLTGNVTGNLSGNVTGNINNSTLLLQVGGTEKLRLNSDRVIIGQTLSNNQPTYNSSTTFVTAHTNNPGAWNAIAIISGNSTGASFLKFGDRDDEDISQIGHYNSDNSLRFYTNGSSGGERLRIASDGKVGINQSSPRTTLDVSGYVYLGNGGQIQITGSAGAKGLQLAGADDGANIIGTMGSSGEHLVFRTASSERMRLLVGGPHLLIGGTSGLNEITESSSNSGLVIGNTSMGNGGLAIINSTSGTGRIYFGDATGSNTARNRGQINYYHNGDYMLFATAGSERLRIASDGVITAQKSATFGNTSDSFTAVQITSSTSGISELRFGDTTANAGYVKYEHSSNNLILASNATPRMTIQSTGIVKVETSDSSGLNAHMLVNNSESSAGISLLGSGSSFSSGGWAAVTDAGIIRSSAGAANGLVLQAASGDLKFYAGGNPPAERFRIASDGTPAFFSPAVAWHEGPAILEASNGYAEIFFRSTGSTHGTSITGTWSIGKLAGTAGFGILKNGMTGGGAVRSDAPLSISNAGDITIGKQLLTPKRPAFFVTMNGGNQTTTAANRLPFDTVVHNEGSHYQTSGSNIYNFVCPVAGFYFFGAQVWLKHGSGTGNHARWEIWRDSTIVALAGWHQNGVNLTDMQSSATVTIYCDAGAKVYVEADYDLTYWRGNASQPHTFFHGFLIG